MISDSRVLFAIHLHPNDLPLLRSHQHAYTNLGKIIEIHPEHAVVDCAMVEFQLFGDFRVLGPKWRLVGPIPFPAESAPTAVAIRKVAGTA